MIRIYRWVPHHRLPDYEALGWMPFELGLPHSDYSVGCVWLCQCRCVEPK